MVYSILSRQELLSVVVFVTDPRKGLIGGCGMLVLGTSGMWILGLGPMMMKRLRRVVGLLALAVMPLAAQAEGRLVVLELFTSQGCDRCPPVDALVAELAQREDVLPLALHVDYWDYLGWKDAFALAEHKDRQMAYAPRTDRRRLFTPLLMVGGLDPVEGYTPMKVVDLIEKHRGVDAGVSLELTVQGEMVHMVGLAAQPFGAPAHVVMVQFRPQAIVEITRGQNAGQTVAYTNVVTGWHDLGTWDGHAPLAVEMPQVEEAGAVLVQSAEHGLILAAERLP